MQRYIVVVALLMTCVRAAYAQRIELDYDWRAAERLVALMSDTVVTDAQLAELLKLPGVQATIRKNRQFRATATDSMFVASLRAAIAGGPRPANDAFFFPSYKQRLPRIRELVAVIKPVQSSIADTVQKRLAPWVPAGLNLKIPTVIAFGGTSAGWAMADTQYIGLHAYGGAADLHAIINGAVHEAFHVIQRRIMPEIPAGRDTTVTNTLKLLQSTIMEGTAAYISDPTDAPGDGDYMQWEQQYYRRNFNRLPSNFRLLESLLFRVRNDASASYNDVYQIGFTSQWDSPGYFVGHRMTEQLIKYDGVPGVLALIQRPAPEFFKRYITLYRQHADDERFIKFAPRIERLIEGL